MNKYLQDKLLLIGSGMLQDNLTTTLAERIDTIEQSESVSTAEAATDLIQSMQPNSIVYAGPLSLSAWEAPWRAAGVSARSASDSLAADAIDWSHECEIVAALAAGAELVHAKFVLISTDSIFAGPRLFHEEDSAAHLADKDTVGRMNVEQAALRHASNSLVLRTHAFGWSRGRSGFAERIHDLLAIGQPVQLDSHSHATPMLATDLAAFVERSLRLRLQGLCHCTGAERTSQVRFAEDIAAVGGFDARLILAAPNDDATVSLAMPCRETSLNCRRARRTFETPMPMLREGIERFIEQAENGYCQRLAGQSARRLVAA